VKELRPLSRSSALPSANASSAPDIYALIPKSLDSDAVNAIAAAYQNTISELGLTGRIDPLTEIVAMKIIDIAQTGERDPARIQAHVVSGLAALG
jgi:hypothetical protein